MRTSITTSSRCTRRPDDPLPPPAARTLCRHPPPRPSATKALVVKLGLAVYSPADSVVEEGDVGHEIFFVASGTLTVSIKHRRLMTLSAGACFGEIAVLLPNTRRSATVTAQTFAELFILARKDFHEVSLRRL